MKTLGLAIGWLGVAGTVSAQAASQTPADSQPGTAPRPVVVLASRAAWFSDRLPLRIGDLLTIVVDEQAAASERVSTVASADRALRARLGINVDSAVRLGPAKDFSTGHNSSSRDVGESGRTGALTAVLSVRVTNIDQLGIATVEGAKTVTVDGRVQEVRLKGLVRAEDVSPSNVVSSSRVADAVITYKGKKIGPRAGILGKILSILWP
ncbi:MAG: flagellar basal body L-ring protein FlgH [Gemmatimonadales bacterium]